MGWVVEMPEFITRMKKILTKDIEFSRRYWIESILTAWAIGVAFFFALYIFIDNGYEPTRILPFIITGSFLGAIVYYFGFEKISKKYMLISVLQVVNIICLSTLQVNITTSWYSFGGILYFIVAFCIVASFLEFLGIMCQTTGILERGRVIASILASVVVLFPLFYLAISIPLILPFLFVFIVLYPVFMVISDHFSDLYISPSITLRDTLNEKLLKYTIILSGIAFIQGLIYPSELLNFDIYSFNFAIFSLPLLLGVVAIIFGVIFDLYGRRRTVGLLIFLIGMYLFLTSFGESSPIVQFPLGIYTSLLIIDVIAILTIVADIAIAPSKVLPLFSLALVISILLGVWVKELLIQQSLSALPSAIGFFGIITISQVLINTTDTLPSKEKEWNKSISKIYVMHSSGILIYQEDFKNMPGERLVYSGEKINEKDENKPRGKNNNQESDLDPLHDDLVSSGLIGITQLMQEIMNGKDIIRSIDNHLNKILLERGNYIIVALVSSLDLRILREKLRKFIEEFEIEFLDMLEKSNHVNTDAFEGTWRIIEKYFHAKYL